MSTLKIIGYETGMKKIIMARLLQKRLALDEVQSRKMTDAIISGNVISLKFEDSDYAAGLSEELVEAGARVEIEGEDE